MPESFDGGAAHLPLKTCQERYSSPIVRQSHRLRLRTILTCFDLSIVEASTVITPVVEACLLRKRICYRTE